MAARFGRGGFFIVLDTESGDFDVVDNTQNVNASQGAGIQAAQNVVSRDPDALAACHVGPKAFRVLSAAGVKVYLGAEGTVAETVANFKQGKLEAADQEDVEGHWV